eukprot:TRINITY_DN3678_c0_g1_i2.p1 TRINITY_DN3678_c0_g1~~TRINITY_DN3678_c0_g1_i2.p1  ORF type:complete len:164 (+),score=40.56 TRINITY_DN3678_c0_g1_i2:77-568(+)
MTSGGRGGGYFTPCGNNALADPARIAKGLWLGSAIGASNRHWMTRERIRYVLNATGEVPNFFDGDPLLTYCRLELSDALNEDIVQHADTICDFIKQAKQRDCGVLVHCQAGVSRSASAVLIYLMKEGHMTLQESLKLVCAAKPNISPNPGTRPNGSSARCTLF